MDFDQYKRPMIEKKDAVARLQSKVAAQAKEIARLTLQLQALKDDLIDIKRDRDDLAARNRRHEDR